MTQPADQLTQDLEAAGYDLPPQAAILLEAYEQQVHRLRDARDRINTEGMIIAGPRDQPIPHPALAIERAATTEVARLHREIMSNAVRRRH